MAGRRARGKVPQLCQRAASGDVAGIADLLSRGHGLEEPRAEWESALLTPLMMAVVHDQLPAVALLCDRGADLHATCRLYSNHRTLASEASVLGLAAQRASVAVVEELLRRGCRVNGTATVRAPLCWAAEAGRPDTAAVLLAGGADPNGGIAALRKAGVPICKALRPPLFAARPP
jgi:ankyrin repeat protein